MTRLRRPRAVTSYRLTSPDLRFWCLGVHHRPVDTPSLLTTGQVATALATSRQHVVDLCDSGRLRHVRVGTHRRIPRDEVNRLLAPAGAGDLTTEQERSWWLHLAVLGELAVDPDRVLATAHDNIARWRDLHRADGRTHQSLLQWEGLVQAGVPAVVSALTDRSARGCELRQNSPFAGVLDASRRAAVLRAVAAGRGLGHAS